MKIESDQYKEGKDQVKVEVDQYSENTSTSNFKSDRYKEGKDQAKVDSDHLPCQSNHRYHHICHSDWNQD